MASLSPHFSSAIVVDVFVDEHDLHVRVKDGRTISAPLSWFPRLLSASANERSNWRLIGQGEGIHWPELDEDISIAALLHGR